MHKEGLNSGELSIRTLEWSENWQILKQIASAKQRDKDRYLKYGNVILCTAHERTCF